MVLWFIFLLLLRCQIQRKNIKKMETQKENPKTENLRSVEMDLCYVKSVMYHLEEMLFKPADHFYYCSEDVVKMAMCSVKELVFEMCRKLEEEKGGENGN